jgi:hypothetical protein
MSGGNAGTGARVSKGPKGKSPPAGRLDDITEWRKRPVRKRLNASGRRTLKAAALQLFVKQVGRKAQKGEEPNDRSYSWKTAAAVRRMSSDQLDELLRDGEE